MKTQEQSLSASILLSLTLTFFHITSGQLSPVQAPVSSPPQAQAPAFSPPSPPATAPSPGFNSVPLVPVTPSGAPTPTVPKAPSIDIVQILRKAKRFSVLTRLLKTTQLINQLNSQLITSGSGGLTLFAPEDAAFSKLKAGFLNSLTDRQKVELLQFHTLSSFVSISNFDTLTNPVQTQAGDDPLRLQLNVTTVGGGSSMATGAVNASVTGTVYADNKLAVYQVDKVLLPLDLVLPAKAPAPAPAKAKGASPKTKAGPDGGAAGDDGDGGDNKDLPTEASSAGNVRLEGMWVAVVLAVALMFLSLRKRSGDFTKPPPAFLLRFPVIQASTPATLPAGTPGGCFPPFYRLHFECGSTIHGVPLQPDWTRVVVDRVRDCRCDTVPTTRGSTSGVGNRHILGLAKTFGDDTFITGKGIFAYIDRGKQVVRPHAIKGEEAMPKARMMPYLGFEHITTVEEATGADTEWDTEFLESICRCPTIHFIARRFGDCWGQHDVEYINHPVVGYADVKWAEKNKKRMKEFTSD
ncbi:LOW QUALITY PROTEIN: hypothetical protein Fmac_008951 [Flemingia macrophylla]|uniref:FAS1 domain-containing protein n=1 Tax=Flemingia macrophylla TaxID=520843 RepID=A0ABD1MZD7_9FABA